MSTRSTPRFSSLQVLLDALEDVDRDADWSSSDEEGDTLQTPLVEADPLAHTTLSLHTPPFSPETLGPPMLQKPTLVLTPPGISITSPSTPSQDSGRSTASSPDTTAVVRPSISFQKNPPTSRALLGVRASPLQRPKLGRGSHSFHVAADLTLASRYSHKFPVGHHLNMQFVRRYMLEYEMGSGGYGFVMTARRRCSSTASIAESLANNASIGEEVAVKFILKSKVHANSWTDGSVFGFERMPMEAKILKVLNHPGIVACLDLFEDEAYFYVVQELHGSPWQTRIGQTPAPAIHKQTLPDIMDETFSPERLKRTLDVEKSPYSSDSVPTDDEADDESPTGEADTSPRKILKSDDYALLQPPPPRPPLGRRMSQDLFECIEQHARLSEPIAKHIMAQVVAAVAYLHENGISHRDIKDENILVDNDFRAKLIDFGSAVYSNPEEPQPYYNLFFGTTSYASSEILLQKPYRAPPAEVWTLGVLMSYLLTGASPFAGQQDAIAGRIHLERKGDTEVSRQCMDLTRRCLDPDPDTRISVHEMMMHPWLYEYFYGL